MKIFYILSCSIKFLINITIAFAGFGKCNFCVYIKIWVEICINDYEYCLSQKYKNAFNNILLLLTVLNVCIVCCYISILINVTWTCD